MERDIKAVQRGNKIFEEHSKRFQTLTKEIHSINGAVRQAETNFSVGTEKMEADFERIDKRFDTELGKFAKQREQIQVLEARIDEFKKAQVETHLMHNEELHQRMRQITETINQLRGKQVKISQEQLILNDKYETAMERLEQSFLRLSRDRDDIEAHAEGKLDTAVFDKTLRELNVTLHQTIQRLTFTEEQSQKFGEFVFNFIPIWLQSMLTKNLNAIGDFGILEKHEAYLKDVVPDLEARASQRTLLFAHLRHEKQRLLESLKVIQGNVHDAMKSAR